MQFPLIISLLAAIAAATCDVNSYSQPITYVSAKLSPANNSAESQHFSDLGLDENIPIEFVDLDEDSGLHEDVRGTGRVNCYNCGKISRNKFGESVCAPGRSVGYYSSHNCAAGPGHSYLCVRPSPLTGVLVGYCYTSKRLMRGLNAENGECFT